MGPLEVNGLDLTLTEAGWCLHTVIGQKRWWEAHQVRDSQERDERRQVDEELGGEAWVPLEQQGRQATHSLLLRWWHL